MNTKAQATLFIFLGIIIFAILTILVTIVARDQESSAQEQQILTRSEMQPIQDYVERCLTLVSTEAIDLIGRQGFALYTSQGGTIDGINPNDEGTEYLRYDGDAVTYRIRLTPENSITDGGKIIISNSRTQTEQFGDTRLLVYPWASYPTDPFTGATTTYLSSGFGWNALPSLNRIGPNSIEAQIEGYLTARMPQCTDWTNYPEFRITAGAPQAQVLFAQKNTIITIKWRLELHDSTGRRGVLEDFVTSLPVRLSTIHSFVNSIIDQDVSNITFDITSPQTEFTIFAHDAPDGSIVRIIDPHSTLHGRPYEARFARENRAPALERVSQDELNTPTSDYLLGNCAGAVITFSGTTFFVDTANSSCSSTISIPLIAIDPDEENVTYSARGRLGIPHTITHADIQSPFPCIPYTLVATDGHDEDWQEINLRTKSIHFAPQCVQQ